MDVTRQHNFGLRNKVQNFGQCKKVTKKTYLYTSGSQTFFVGGTL